MKKRGRYIAETAEFLAAGGGRRRRIPLVGLVAALGIALILLGLWWAGPPPSVQGPSGEEETAQTPPDSKEPEGLGSLLASLPDSWPYPPQSFTVGRQGGRRYRVACTPDPALQAYIARVLKTCGIVQGAVVVLNPHDGRVLAMVSHGEEPGVPSLCLRATYPAASLIKIVSAAAALEEAGLDPDASLAYRGRKYTLYRSQLKKTIRKGATRTTLRRAFATSVNPVFGRLGIYDLGREILSRYAEAFLFNREIPFDLPVEPSSIQVPEDPFGLAEIASGFNKRTTLSPLHAALLAAAAANGGTMMGPWFVKSIHDGQGRSLYQAKPRALATPIRPETAKDLRVLMAETVRTGTCRRAFYRLRRKSAFRGVELGAKTGTINDPTGKYKVDWLAAYALPGGGGSPVALAVLALHGEKLGARANEIGRVILDYYFRSTHVRRS